MLDYILEITALSGLEELIEARLFLSSSTGSSSVERDGKATVAAYFDSAAERDAARLLFEGLEVEVRPVDRKRQDWLDQYQQSLKPMEIGRRFVVAPDRALIARSERIPIVIPQEQAFGTGSHETTALCLEMLEDEDLEGATALDVGSGSGVLAIAMSLLGARTVVAFDNDPEALPVLRTNLERNGCGRSVLSFCGTADALLRSMDADLAVMNILPEVIVPLLRPMATLLRREAVLMVSGVLVERAAEVKAAARGSRYRFIRERTAGEWWCGVYTRQ